MNDAIHEQREQREASAFHEAGHVVVTMCFGGTINHEGVEIDERCYCGSRFFLPRNDAAARERLTVFNAMAGWRAEHLHHGKGGMCDGQDNAEDLTYVLECLRSGDDEECEEIGDDVDAFREMLLHTPDASDDELIARYAHYSAQCYALLREPTIWSAVESVAAALLKAGKLDMDDVIEAIGGSTAPLSEACERVLGRPAAKLPVPKRKRARARPRERVPKGARLRS